MARRSWVATLGLLLAASLAGCASIQNGGPVQSFPITEGPGGQSQPFNQPVAQTPGAGWTPTKIVYGFLGASASLGDQQLAREYLTPAFSKGWHPGWTATVFSHEPVVTFDSSKDHPKAATATVTISGVELAYLQGLGTYAVPSASAPQRVDSTFTLVKNAAGHWRIDQAPAQLLLTSFQFSSDYQQRNLYFFDPGFRSLVPDPVYVPLQDTAADLMDKLAQNLIKQPKDWLNGATATAFPAGTAVSDVTLDGGTATVNLTGARIGKASYLTMQQVSSQLLLTLTGESQGGPPVKSIEVIVNGHLWIPKNSQENPVQNTARFQPPPPAPSGVFYYLDGAGNLMDQVGPRGTPVLIQEHLGKQYSKIAISSGLNGPYVAAVSSNSSAALFTGPVGGRLVQRGGSAGYSSMSWDPNGGLWATTEGTGGTQTLNQVVELRGDATPGTPGFLPVSYAVTSATGGQPSTVGLPFTAIRVAPDGVRVALIAGESALYFGAIDAVTRQIKLSPFSVSVPQGTSMFTALTWYGPDNVITLGNPGQVLTEYPVNGGSSTSIPPPPGIQSVTASDTYALIAVVAKGELYADPSLTGSWAPLNTGSKEKAAAPPVYPG